MCAARFKRHEKRRAFDGTSMFLRIVKRFNLSVRKSGLAMPSTPDDFSALYQYRAHHRIWRSRAISPSGEAQCKAHKTDVRHWRAS